MGAAAHLGIDLAEYDARIRTFIPFYEELLGMAAQAAASLVQRRAPVIVDLGVGTGSLSARVQRAIPQAHFIGIDEDPAMLGAAAARLGSKLATVQARFEAAAWPRADAFIASLALHHLATPAVRLRLFRRLRARLRPGGCVISADCYPASLDRLRRHDRARWLGHLEEAYTPQQARRYLRAWAREDRYVPLLDELQLFRRAGFVADVYGRRGPFAVVAAVSSRPRI